MHEERRDGDHAGRPTSADGSAGDTTAATTGTVETNGVRTHYERRGDGPALVFVHGSVMNAEQWRPQVGALADEYATVTYDIRGHGRTGPSAVERYDLALFVADLDALLTGLEVDRAVLCGASFGGVVVQAYAATHPERVAGLVLADTFTADLSAPGERFQLLALRATVLPVRLLGIERVQRLRSWLFERFSPGASGDYGAVERLQADAPPMTDDEFAKVVRAMARVRPANVDYDAIDVPTTVVHGEHAPGFLRRQSERLAGKLPGATLRVVPGGGHASNVDDPAVFNAAVRDLAERAFATGN